MLVRLERSNSNARNLRTKKLRNLSTLRFEQTISKPTVLALGRTHEHDNSDRAHYPGLHRRDALVNMTCRGHAGESRSNGEIPSRKRQRKRKSQGLTLEANWSSLLGKGLMS